MNLQSQIEILKKQLKNANRLKKKYFKGIKDLDDGYYSLLSENCNLENSVLKLNKQNGNLYRENKQLILNGEDLNSDNNKLRDQVSELLQSLHREERKCIGIQDCSRERKKELVKSRILRHLLLEKLYKQENKDC